MRRSDDMAKFLSLREARLQRAEADLVRQQTQCEAARAHAAGAAVRVVAHRNRQEESERAMLDDLVGRAVTVNDIERLRTALAVLEEQGADLDRAERNAAQAMREAAELKQAMTADRNRRRREQDKMRTLVGHLRKVAQRSDEIRTEVDQEEWAPRGASQAARQC